MKIDLSFVIITHNRKKKLKRLIESIELSYLPKINYEIIVVDDCSSDETASFIRKAFSNLNYLTIISNPKNFKASVSRNIGMKSSLGEYVYCLDDDVILDEKGSFELLQYIRNQNNKKFIVSPVMFEYNDTKKIWFAGLSLNLWTTIGKFLHIKKNYNEILALGDTIRTDGIVTAFMMRRAHVPKIGFFDEKLFPFQFEELDFFIRGRYLGFKLFVVTRSILYHDHEYGSFLNNPWRLELTAKNRILISRLWSTRKLQEISSLFFCFVLLIEYIILKVSFFREKPLASFIALYRGTIAGLKILHKIKPYRFRNGFNASNLNKK
jgi:GT2 family glycosyltransferase